ncbi:hypothetical protein C0991_005120 [Blastosporella zonata]|nr:hypothetical protein C0991_005120 [Blastosporella zonata]
MAPMQKEPGQKGVSWSNIAVGGIMNMVTTLGQPLEVLKTQMAANRSQSMWEACRTVWSRGGAVGYYQGLIPWAWIEASTKGAVLVFTASEVETAALGGGINPALAGLLGGMTGGIAQAYATMGFTTCMKTVEITRHKTAATGVKPPSTWAVFAEIYRKEGLAGVNKGVNAVAVRQCTNWGSRMGFARLAESSIRKIKGKSETESLGAFDKILASTIGGALATWNQPIEVIRVEMQSMAKGAASANRPAKLTILNTLSYIYKENGIKGLYRGVTPRIGLGIWQTVCMVSFADYVKIWIPMSTSQAKRAHPLLLRYLGELAANPLRTKAITTGTLCFLQEVLGSTLAGVPVKRASKNAPSVVHALAALNIDSKALKMAIYGFLVSAPLSHYLTGTLQKAFAGKTGTGAKIAQILANSLLVSPITSAVFLASMAVINGAKTIDEIIKTVKAGFFSVLRLWVPFFQCVQFTLGTFFNVRVKTQLRIAAAKKAAQQKAEQEKAEQEKAADTPEQ